MCGCAYLPVRSLQHSFPHFTSPTLLLLITSHTSHSSLISMASIRCLIFPRWSISSSMSATDSLQSWTWGETCKPSSWPHHTRSKYVIHFTTLPRHTMFALLHSLLLLQLISYVIFPFHCNFASTVCHYYCISVCCLCFYLIISVNSLTCYCFNIKHSYTQTFYLYPLYTV